MGFTGLIAGTYTMGSPVSETGRDADETEVSTTVEAFVIGTTEVTQAHYLAVRALSPSHFTGSNRPVEMVSYLNAQAFCAALSALPAEIAMGRSYRLPTEAEWEYACRSGTATAYSFGVDDTNIATYAWYTTNSGAETHDVQGKSTNAWSLSDTHGNVWEWATNSRLPGVEGEQVIRGGGWNSTAAECRSASRTSIAETTTRNDIGFRVVMVRAPIPQIADCEYVVTLDGEEVYRATCYEGASCRDPSGSVGVLIGYDEGTLTWSKHEPRPLAVVVDPDTGCNDFFCGTCRCTCRTLCATLIIPNVTTLRGKLYDVTYSDCDGPVWSGTVGDYDLTVTLGKDQYDGSCIASLSANDEDGGWVEVTGCEDLTATWELYDGTTVSVTCQACSNCEPICEPCPEPTLYPTLTVSVYPLANCSISGTFTVTYDSSIGSWNGSGPWVTSGSDELVIRLSCVGNSFMASVYATLSGGLVTACSFGATSPTNQDCALLLYDWQLLGSIGGQRCCGGALFGSDLGLTVIL
jgi:hypothetical protein